MMKLTLDSVSEINCQSNSNCTFDHYTEPVVLSGIILTFIGLLIGLLIIFIKKLHSTSIVNICFMAITLIIMIIGVGLLNSRTRWGGTFQLYCTRCILDLLVLYNVNCDCIHSILFVWIQ
ncbi:unnamed protein product [Schistosoma bovis]|nr:unnamed protein product [Schistosoma bovis]